LLLLQESGFLAKHWPSVTSTGLVHFQKGVWVCTFKIPVRNDLPLKIASRFGEWVHEINLMGHC